MNEKLSIPKIDKLKDIEVLYIIADEKWISTQRNNRNYLNNKMTFSGGNDAFIFDALNYIESVYDISQIKIFYILGDSASWSKNLKYHFNFNPNIQIIQSLDKFHLKQCLWRILPQEDVVKTLFEYIISNNKKD